MHQESNIIFYIVPDSDISSGGVSYVAMNYAYEQSKYHKVLIHDLSGHNINPTCFSYISLFKVYKILFANIFKTNPNLHVVHFHGFWNPKFWALFLMVNITNTRYVISPHGSLEPEALQFGYFKKKFFRHLFIDRFLAAAKAIVVYSEKEYLSVFSLDNLKFSIFIKTKIGISLPPNSLEQSLSSGVRSILCISRLHPAKGLMLLVDAWHKIKDRNWKIIIAGPDDGCKQQLIDHIKKLGLTDFFIFTGPIDADHKSALFSAASIFILPSFSENFGVVVAEALSYGLPVITTTNTPWVSTSIESGCICVPPKIEEISKELARLIRLDAHSLSLLGSKGRAYIQERHNWTEIGLNYEKSFIDNVLLS